jgi:phosphoribosyl 1,2-cyclic phosphodiesterase
MEISFFGVRGSIPAPGPGTVRYGGNTSCVRVQLGQSGHPGHDELIVLDCGTGARNLGLALLGGVFGQGKGTATFLLSHAHWDHIQGFPFFVPFYTPGNRFTIYGGESIAQLEQVLEGQMAAQYFPVQSFRNMGATLDLRAVKIGHAFSVGSARVTARWNPHGHRARALAFRIEDRGRALVYASDAGYGPDGPTREILDLYRGADLLIHDSTFTPEDRAERVARGLSSLVDAVDAAVRAEVRRLALFHYDQDYADHDVDQLVERGRRMLAGRGAGHIEILGAAEGLSVRL